MFDFDAFIHWEMSTECNFRCSYCFLDDYSSKCNIDIKNLLRMLNYFGKKSLISITGGEPFLVPNFIDIVKTITKNHYVRIDTNLSITTKCLQFSEEIDPSKIPEIVYSIHPKERNRLGMKLNDLFLTVKHMQRKGFHLIGNYIIHPEYMDSVEADIKDLRRQGFDIRPSLFIGEYKSVSYPFNSQHDISYPTKIINLMKSLNLNFSEDYYFSKNLICPAGHRSFLLNSKGDVFPCFSMQHIELGKNAVWKYFKKPLRCPYKECFCSFAKNYLVSDIDFDEYNERFILGK